MFGFTRICAWVTAIYVLGIWMWTGDQFWSLMAAVVSVICGFITGLLMHLEESNLPLAKAMVFFRAFRRLGGAGINGCFVVLSLYGAAAAYPVAFGHPSLHDYAPADGSLVRAAGMAVIWITSVVAIACISLYRKLRRRDSVLLAVKS
jgi:hypothetical protein